jgi:hypothetical protein
MARSLGSVVTSLFSVLPVALVALSVGCGSTVVGGGDVEDDRPGCARVVLDDGSIVRSPLCDVAEEVNEDGASDGEDGASDGEDGASDGEDGASDGEDGDPCEDGSTSCDDLDERSSALAYRLSGDGSSTSGSESTSAQVGGGEAEDRVVLQIANHDAASCGDRYATPPCPFEALAVSVSIPEGRFVAGEEIALGDPDVFVSFSEQGANEGTDDCWGTGSGGGTGEPGTLTIDAYGQGTVDVTFAGTAFELLEGAHTALFCQ